MRIYLIAVAICLLPATGAWVMGSYFESSSYNRITGAKTTTWDAMFLQLRVTGAPKD